MATVTPTATAPSVSSRNQRTITRLSTHSAVADIGTAILVILTPSDDPSDRRTISLQPGAAMVIGRASNTGGRNLGASPANALFPRPVVSRSHAELRAHPHRPLNQQITITDSDSTHGTYVNDTRLDAHRPCALRDGDEIKLGDRVSRGDETHNAVTLHYRRAGSISNLVHSSHPLLSKGFQVPSESEDESDPASDAESVVSFDEEVEASANTTPEQPKMTLGSQEKPIELDRPAEVIYLDDDEEDGDITLADNNIEAVGVQPSASSRGTGRGGSIELGEPVMLAVKDTYDSDEGEVEHIDDPDYDEEADIVYMSEEEDFSDREQESDVASEMNNGLDEDHEEDMGLHYHPPTHTPLSQNATDASVVKETLFVSPPAARPATTLNAHSLGQDGPNLHSFPQSHSQSAFDPVRGVHLPNPATASQPRAPSSYTYDSLLSHSLPRNSTTDIHGSSRWDVQPAVLLSNNQVNQINNSQPFYTAPPAPQDFSFSGQSVRPSSFDWAFPESVKESSGPSAAPSEFIHPSFTSPSFPYGNWTSNPEPERLDNSSFTPRSPRKKISIPDITQRAEEERSNFVMPQAPVMDEATFDLGLQVPAPAVSCKATAGRKRKAEETSDIDSDDDHEIEVQDSIDGLQVLEVMLERAHAEQAIIQEAQPARASIHPVSLTRPKPRPAKKARVTGALNVAKMVSKYAAVAGAGAGGMVAFLASPYAQQVLEWMG
ncbi:hypothetical protein LTR78_001356 [Recurvomyces mirabilis]|uniref:FHA domain-containing protein n=1 Tax=Recurvomyces mirabilis TaxID=574656 RepID=A0AAE0WVX4_9PEZI|nr:hypothetical protein LTR78_001356 [Recurvomyces mirabilis]KAK5161333.1 hypothetical protein LTS14_001129 [Recurvomyces mirabilis]